jgi:hypothetical protein
MTFTFGEVQRSLPTKGFRADPDGAHSYFYFYRNGKKTRFYTYTSHGKPGDDVGSDIVRAMKQPLGLGSLQEVRDLVECTIDEARYLQLLIASGALPRDPPADPPAGKNKGARPRKKR